MTQAQNYCDTAAAILRSSMTHVPFDGWSEEALIAGAIDSGFDAETMHAAFPRGAIDAISLHSRLVDQDMVAAFDALPERPTKVHLMIRALVLLRLEIAQPDREAVRRALAILAMPMHAAISAKLLYETVDTMWRAAGQTDTDFNFYTKRATLAAVYSATMLAWLADNSGRFVNIAGFLDRRLGDVARVPKLARPFRALAGLGKRVARGLASGVAARRSRR